MDLDSANIHLFCRLCAKSFESNCLIPIFGKMKNDILQQLKKCICIKMRDNDGLPKNICKNCSSKLDSLYKFKLQCESADKMFRNALKQRSKITRSCDKISSYSSEQSSLNVTTYILNDFCEIINTENISPLIGVVGTSKQDLGTKDSKEKKYSREDNDPMAPLLVSDTSITLHQSGKCEKPKLAKNISSTTPIVHILDLDCSKRITKESQATAGATKKKDAYICQFCNKRYPSEGGWRYHLRIVHSETYQPFICDLCGKTFKVKKNLESHKKSVHLQIKEHLCDLCGRGFATKYALKVHTIWHSDEKNFPCEICGYRFRTKGILNTHRVVHGGPKKFMCEVCSRNFRWKKDFMIHMRSHTGERPYACSTCGKTFTSATNMKKHERSHACDLAAANRLNTTQEHSHLLCKQDSVLLSYHVPDT